MNSRRFPIEDNLIDTSLLTDNELRGLVDRLRDQILGLQSLLSEKEFTLNQQQAALKCFSRDDETILRNKNSIRHDNWINQLPIGVFEVDVNGFLSSANDICLKWFGLSEEDIANKISVFNCLQPEEYDKAKANFEYILTQDDVSTTEFIARSTDGTLFPVLISSYSIHYPDKSVGLRGAIFNFSAQKQADEHALIRDIALRTSLGAIGLADLNGRVIYVNDAFVKQWGYKGEQEIIGRSIYDFTMSDIRMDNIIKSLRKGLVYEGDGKARKADGSSFDIKMSAHIVYSHKNNPICMMASFLDVSEQKEAVEKLTENEKWINTTLDDMIEGYQVIDLEWRYRYLNKSAIRYSKKSSEELIGNRITDVYPGIEDSFLYQKLSDCMNNRSSEVFEDEFRYQDGTKGWFEFHVEPTKEGISILTMDISDKKNSEQKLIVSEERYRTLFETSALGIIYLNENGTIISANASAEKILGRSFDQLVGHDTADSDWLPIREDGTPFPFDERPVNVSLKTGKECYAIMGLFNRVLGKYVWVKVNTYIQRSQVTEYGRVIYASFEDITHLKEAIEDLNRSNQLLNSLRDIDHAISRATLTDNFVDEIVLRRLSQMLPSGKIEIVRFDFEKGEAVVESQIKGDVFVQKVGFQLPMSVFDLEKLKRGEPAFVPIRLDINEIHKMRHQGLKEILSVPLLIDGDLVGVLAIFRESDHPFTLQQIRIAEDISAQIAVNIKQQNLMLKQKEYSDNLGKMVAERTKELQEITAFQQTILDNAGVGIISISTDGVIQTFNPTAEEITGYTAAEVVGIHTPILFSDINEARAAVNNETTSDQECSVPELVSIAIKRRTPKTSEYNYITKSKKRVPVLVNSTTLKDSAGNVTGIVGFVFDITQRKMAEEELRKSEERFSRMFYDHEAIMLLIDPATGRIVNANNSAQSFYGYNFSEMEYNIEDINILPKETINQTLRDAVANHLNYFVFPHRISSGAVRNVEVHASPIEIEGNKLLFTIIHDVTERTEIERKLTESEAINRAIINGVPDILFRFDREGKYLMCHTNNPEMLILPEEQILGRKIQEVLPPADAELTMNAITQALESKKIVTLEYELLLNQEVHYFEDRFVAINDNEVLTIGRDITDRKKAEISLQWNESLLRIMASSSPLAFYVVDNRTEEILYFNQQFCRIWRILHLEEKIRNKDLTNSEIESLCLSLAKNKKALGETMASLRDIGNDAVVEDFIELKDGRTIRRYSTQLHGENGQYYGRFFIFEDVSVKMKAELQLRMQTAAFETFALAIVITDKYGTVEWANPAFSQLTGYSNKEVIGAKIGFVKSGKYSEDFYKELWDTISSGRVWKGEFVNCHKSGRLYYEENTITPVLDKKGNVTHYIAMKVDITVRKEMEEALRLSEQRWQFALEGAGDGVWDWNYQTGKIYFSHQWKSMLGYDDPEIGDDISEWENLVMEEDLTLALESLEKHFRGEQNIYTCEIRMRCKDGSQKWILTRGKLVEWDDDGLPLRIIGTHTDISEIKEAEERLRLAVEQEKALNDMKSRFVSIASHEFRTPLASILLASQLLSQHWTKMEPARIEQKLQKIKTQTEHLGAIVNDVLELSRMQEGKIAFQPEHLDLTAMCKEISEEFNHTADGSMQRIFLHIPEKPVIIHADRRLIRQVLNNLITNAIKYTQNDPHVEVSLLVGGFGCQIGVHDNGIGIPLEDQKHLFTPFFRASNVGVIQGNGLGLNIMRESIRIHGGDVRFESKQNIGTVFFVNLPKDVLVAF